MFESLSSFNKTLIEPLESKLIAFDKDSNVSSRPFVYDSWGKRAATHGFVFLELSTNIDWSIKAHCLPQGLTTVSSRPFVYGLWGKRPVTCGFVFLELSTTLTEALKLIAFHKDSTVLSCPFVYDSWGKRAAIPVFVFLELNTTLTKRWSSLPFTKIPMFYLVELCPVH